MSPAEQYGYALGFDAGYVEFVVKPAEEYRAGEDPYAKGYMAGWYAAHNGAGVPRLEPAREASVKAQTAAWDAQRKPMHRRYGEQVVD